MATVKREFVSEETLERMRQAMLEHPATEHTAAGGWCKHCGCGNDVLGYRHLPNCTLPKPVLSSEERLLRIKQIIEDVDNRCLAADGPVTPTLQEMTVDEMRRIYALACGQAETWRPA